MPHGLKCTPTTRTQLGYSSTYRRVHTPMNHPSANSAGGTPGAESRRRTGSPKLRNRCADGIGGTLTRRWRGGPVRQ
jgi:hypothetical protein